MNVLLASLVVYSTFASAATSSISNKQLGIWVPNPCDTYGKLPSVLRPSFGVYNHLDNLNSITAYDRYTVTFATPATDEVGWGWNTEGQTPTLTSPYNSATCSSHYASTTNGNVQQTDQTATATTKGETTSISANEPTTTDQKTQPPTTTTQKESARTDQITKLPATDASTNTATTALTSSKPAAQSTEVLSSVASDNTNAGTTTAPSSTAATATDTSIATTKATAPSASTVSVGPVPTNIEADACFAKPAKGEGLWVNPSHIRPIAEKFCTIMRKYGTVLGPREYLSSGDKLWVDQENHVTFLLKIENGYDYPVVAVPDDDTSFNDCATNFFYAWQRCWWNGGKGGTLRYNNFAWTFQPTKT